MSYSYEKVQRRTRSATRNSYGASSHRTAFGYWIPLALTVTAATVGLVAWIWSERKDDEEDRSDGEYAHGGKQPPGVPSMSGALPAGPGPGQQPFQGPPPGVSFQGPSAGSFQGPPPQGDGFQGPPPQGGNFPGPPPGSMPGPPDTGGFQGPPQGAMGMAQPGGYQEGGFAARSTGVETQEETTLISRVSGALKRTPSPAQSLDWASKTVTAGVVAAGAAVGGALSSIKEGSQDAYEDHERWSQEAESRDNGATIKQGIKRRGTADEFFSGESGLPRQLSMKAEKRKTVAMVVSAVELEVDGGSDVGHHASILSHLPDHVDPLTARVFVLIYAPDLKAHPLSPIATRRTSQSMASSFSNISQGDVHTPAHTPGEFPGDSANGILSKMEPNPIDESSSLYKTLHNQAQALVEKDTMIMPFSTPMGHKHLLRSLAPETVYIQESLCGPDGELVGDLSGWVKQTVVVIGDEGGHGGLIDTEDEGDGPPGKTDIWWQREDRTGLGKRVAVVESLKIGDDWRRRVSEQD